MSDEQVKAAWRKHWAATARCLDDAPTSAHDIERSGFYAGYLAAMQATSNPLSADNERLRAALEKIVRECVWLPVGAGDGDTYVVTTPSAASEALPAPPESEPK